jgi:methylamine dehydrogenase accessory protein MauD
MNTLWLASHVLHWVITICLVLVILVISRQIGLMHRRLMPASARIENLGPEIGTKIPESIFQDINGHQIDLSSHSEKLKMLIFISVGCITCQELMPAVKSIRKSEKKYLDVYLFSLSDDEKSNRNFIRSNGLEDVSFIVEREVGRKYNVMSPPYAILVDAGNIVITKGVVNHLDHLESILHVLHVQIREQENDGFVNNNIGSVLLEESRTI